MAPPRIRIISPPRIATPLAINRDLTQNVTAGNGLAGLPCALGEPERYLQIQALQDTNAQLIYVLTEAARLPLPKKPQK